jgi:hypothetical protein
MACQVDLRLGFPFHSRLNHFETYSTSQSWYIPNIGSSLIRSHWLVQGGGARYPYPKHVWSPAGALEWTLLITNFSDNNRQADGGLVLRIGQAIRRLPWLALLPFHTEYGLSAQNER